LITKKAAENPKLKFTSLIHLLNDEEYLYQCFKELERGKAAGVDMRTKESYTEAEIKQAIANVVQEMKTRKYRPQPVRRVFIPKSNGKLRPLGIPTVMDKLIQLAVKKILESIFEPLFLEASYGYRPKRNAHETLKAVNDMLMGQKVPIFNLQVQPVDKNFYCFDVTTFDVICSFQTHTLRSVFGIRGTALDDY